MKEYNPLDNMNDLLRMAAPGTPFREGLENVLRAKTGALIVVGYSPEVMEVVDGGFSINCDFSPNYLYELAKMDGAIILSEDLEADSVCQHPADPRFLYFIHRDRHPSPDR